MDTKVVEHCIVPLQTAVDTPMAAGFYPYLASEPLLRALPFNSLSEL
jgi:hypothetical protein